MWTSILTVALAIIYESNASFAARALAELRDPSAVYISEGSGAADDDSATMEVDEESCLRSVFLNCRKLPENF